MKTGKKTGRKIPKVPYYKTRNFYLSLLPLAAFIIIYFVYLKNRNAEPVWVKEGEVTFLNKDTRQQISRIDVEVAMYPDERAQGLMYRTKMDEDKGMLFLFEREEPQSFWMKNTIIPLDILFISSKGVINTIHHNTTPYSEKSLPSKERSQFVVEVNAGYCQKHGIKEGDLIEYKLDRQ